MTREERRDHLEEFFPNYRKLTAPPTPMRTRREVIAQMFDHAKTCPVCQMRAKMVVAIKERAMEIAGGDECMGICKNCGAEKTNVEPDARKLQCDECHLFEVYGCDEFLIRV